LESSYDSKKYVPLGHLRLRLIELVYLMLKLHKPSIYEALAETEIFATITELFQ